MNLVRCDGRCVYIRSDEDSDAVFSLKDAEQVLAELPKAIADLRAVLREKAERDLVDARKRYVELGGSAP